MNLFPPSFASELNNIDHNKLSFEQYDAIIRGQISGQYHLLSLLNTDYDKMNNDSTIVRYEIADNIKKVGEYKFEGHHTPFGIRAGMLNWDVFLPCPDDCKKLKGRYFSFEWVYDNYERSAMHSIFVIMDFKESKMYAIDTNASTHQWFSDILNKYSALIDLRFIDINKEYGLDTYINRKCENGQSQFYRGYCRVYTLLYQHIFAVASDDFDFISFVQSFFNLKDFSIYNTIAEKYIIWYVECWKLNLIRQINFGKDMLKNKSPYLYKFNHYIPKFELL